VGGLKAPPDYVLTTPLATTVDAAPPATVAELFLPAGGAYGAPFAFPLGHPPAVVASTWGAGRVVYLATGATRHYLRRGLRSLCLLLNNAVDWAADTPRPFRVDGPATLLTQLTCYPGDYTAGTVAPSGEASETLALHLVNYTGDMHENAAYRVNYVAPIRDLAVEIVVPPGRAPLTVEPLITGGVLPFAVERSSGAVDGRTQTVMRFRIPQLAPTETLLIRLEAQERPR
jgi:hypothetical protein